MTKKTAVIWTAAGLAVCIGAATALLLKVPQKGLSFIKNRIFPEVKIQREEFDIEGIEEPVKICFIADAHVSLCDDRDPDMKDYCAERSEAFANESGGRQPEDSFDFLIEEVKDARPDYLFLGGDIIDSATQKNVDYLGKRLEELDCEVIYIMGNHDFTYRNEYFSAKAYEEYLPRVSTVSGSVEEGSRVYDAGEFVILAVDDCNNQVSAKAGEDLRELNDDDKPVIVLQHVPLEGNDDVLRNITLSVWGEGENGNSKVLMGENSCKPNEVTSEYIEEIRDEDTNVELVLSGHIHFPHKDEVGEDVTQVVTGAGYKLEMTEIVLK